MKNIKFKRISLIEVMVVFALIAILLSLLLPALSRGRAAARIAVCMSNQNQIGVGMYGYTTDNDNYLPYAKNVYLADGSRPNTSEPNQGSGFGVSWDDLLNPYLGGNLNSTQSKYGYLHKKDDERALDVFICPSDRWGPRRAGSAAQSYSANQRVMSINSLSSNPAWKENTFWTYEASGNNQVGPNAKEGILKITKINGADKCFTITDAPNNRDNNCHQGSTHGRVVVNRLWQEAGSEQAQLNILFYGVDEQSGGVERPYKDNVGALELHSGKLNYLFIDGHVETLNPYTTIGSGNYTQPKGIWSYDPND